MDKPARSNPALTIAAAVSYAAQMPMQIVSANNIADVADSPLQNAPVGASGICRCNRLYASTIRSAQNKYEVLALPKHTTVTESVSTCALNTQVPRIWPSNRQDT